MYDIEKNKELLMKIYAKFQRQYHINMKMYLYYVGVTDTAYGIKASADGSLGDVLIDELKENAYGSGNYNYINDRFDRHIHTNFIKKFIKEEVSYSVGNKITFMSHSGDEKIIDFLRLSTKHWKTRHDAVLTKNMLIYSRAYELYYIDKNARFCSKVISPRHGIAYTDQDGNVILFLHIFRLSYDSTGRTYIDIYTDSEIIHCDSTFHEIGPRQSHPFGGVPVGIAEISEEGWLDTIYKDIKTLQDAYETNLSDISSEISEFRNAYLVLNNLNLQDEDLDTMKANGILKTKGKDGSAAWLIKNINDTFTQNTMTTIEDKMYQLSCHINSNEKMSSNTSSLALRARLISLEEKCKLNQGAIEDCVNSRHQFLLTYFNKLKNFSYDWRDIDTKFTPNVPQDDSAMATIINTLGDRISTETALSLLSFIDNPQNEVKKIQAEQKANSIGANLLNPAKDNPPAPPAEGAKS